VCVCVDWVRIAQDRVHTFVFCEYSMLSIESWKVCDQLIDYQLSKTRSALWNPLFSVISITFTYVSVRKRCKKTKRGNFIESITWASSIENFQKQQWIKFYVHGTVHLSIYDHRNNQRDAAFCALYLMVTLRMFRASLAHHQEFRKLCVCSQVSYSIILDSVFCLLRAVSVQGFVGPGLVFDGCPLGGVRCELWRHSLFSLCSCMSLVSLCTIRVIYNQQYKIVHNDTSDLHELSVNSG